MFSIRKSLFTIEPPGKVIVNEILFGKILKVMSSPSVIVKLLLPFFHVPSIKYSGIILSSVQSTSPHTAILLALIFPAILKLPPTRSSVLFLINCKALTLVFTPTLVPEPKASHPACEFHRAILLTILSLEPSSLAVSNVPPM